MQFFSSANGLPPGNVPVFLHLPFEKKFNFLLYYILIIFITNVLQKKKKLILLLAAKLRVRARKLFQKNKFL